MKLTALALLTTALMITGMGCDESVKYNISGTWNGGEGNTIYLMKKLGKDSFEKIDSVLVEASSFAMKGSVPEIDRYVLTFGDGSTEELILDGIPIKVTITNRDVESRDGTHKIVQDAAVEGSPEQQILRQASGLGMGKSFVNLGAMFMLANHIDDEHALDSVYKATLELKQGADDRIFNFVDSLNNSYAVAYFIGDFMATEYPFEEVELAYENLTPHIKESYPGQLLTEKIATMRDTNIGGIAPEIELPGPDGKTVKLSSLRGKYVLLDFWASWCGPCLAEVPNVKAIYDQYRDKGFEIYGVSLDNAKQEEAWKASIDRHGMNWVHVSSLQGWDCPVAKRYNVTGIPKMYLLDKEGKIIAMDLRGEELKDKVASLFE